MFRNTLIPKGRNNELIGSKFGFSVSCLGLSDVGSEGRRMVAVGAPYYGPNNQGAVFVYQKRHETNYLELSQIVLPSNSFATGFGMKLSDMLENIDGVTKGFGVAAPESDAMTYIRTRPVVRFKDATSIQVNPASIDPRKAAQINLSVQPMVIKQSNYINDVIVTVTVITDNGRLKSSNSGIETLTLTGGNNIGSRLQFQYSLQDRLVGADNLDLNDPNYSPIRS